MSFGLYLSVATLLLVPGDAAVGSLVNTYITYSGADSTWSYSGTADITIGFTYTGGTVDMQPGDEIAVVLAPFYPIPIAVGDLVCQGDSSPDPLRPYFDCSTSFVAASGPTLTLYVANEIGRNIPVSITLSGSNAIWLPGNIEANDASFVISGQVTEGAVPTVPVATSPKVPGFYNSESIYASATSLSLKFQLNQDIAADDVLVFVLADFVVVGGDIVTFPVDLTLGDPVNQTITKDAAYNSYKGSTNTFRHHFASTVPADVEVTITIDITSVMTYPLHLEQDTKALTVGLVHCASGEDAANAECTGGSGSQTSVVHDVNILSVPGIGVFSSSLSFSPAAAGVPTALTLTFTTGQAVADLDTIDVVLPYFTGADVTGLALSGDDAGLFTAGTSTWTLSTTTLSLIANGGWSADVEVVVVIDLGNGITLPDASAATYTWDNTTQAWTSDGHSSTIEISGTNTNPATAIGSVVPVIMEAAEALVVVSCGEVDLTSFKRIVQQLNLWSITYVVGCQMHGKLPYPAVAYTLTASLTDVEQKETIALTVNIAAVNVKQYHAVIFVGGSGAASFMTPRSSDNPHWQLVVDAHATGRVIGAICEARGILHQTSILKGCDAHWIVSSDGAVGCVSGSTKLVTAGCRSERALVREVAQALNCSFTTPSTGSCALSYA